MTSAGEKSLVSKITIDDFDDVTYSLSDTTDQAITNHFDDCDINKYEYAVNNSVTYISRNNWESTTKFGFDASGNNLNNQVLLTGNSDMASDSDYYNYRGMEDDERMDFPTYSSDETSYSLVDMIKDKDGNEIPYDNQKWEDLLNQLSLEEQATLLSSGLRSTGALSSINKPVTIEDLSLQPEEIESVAWFDFKDVMRVVEDGTRDIDGCRICVPSGGLKLIEQFIQTVN